MFRQQATGHFTANVSGPTHCGPDATSPKTYPYEVEIYYTAEAQLDQNGFLLDNLTFDVYFNSIENVDVSCELLAKQAAEYLHSLANAICPSCVVRVRIWGIPERVYVEYIHPPDGGVLYASQTNLANR